MSSTRSNKIKKLSLLTDIFGNPYTAYSDENLELGYEESAISDAIKRGRYGKMFTQRKKRNLFIDQIAENLDKEKPEILHIACPVVDRKLVFLKSKTAAIPVNDDTILSFLNTQGTENIRLVVLRAFCSNELARNIAKARNCSVVYLKKKESPKRCAQFLTAFYELLSNGVAISRAFNLAKCVASSRAFAIIRKERGKSSSAFIGISEEASFATMFVSTPGKSGEFPLGLLPAELNIAEEVLAETESEFCYPDSRRDIVMKIAYNRPRIVHFSSHANVNMLCFYTAAGERMELEKYWLINVMKEFSTSVRCVVLNSCDNSPIAMRLSEYIDIVIGTGKKAGEQAASTFTREFYSTLVAQSEPLDYKQAAVAAIESIEQSSTRGLYEVHEKQNYHTENWHEIDNRKMEAKGIFLEWNDDPDDARMHMFRSRFEKWYETFASDPCMERIVSYQLKRFRYYSEARTVDALKKLYSQLKEHKSFAGHAIYCPVLTEQVGISSSTDFWFTFCKENHIPEAQCVREIKGNEAKLSSTLSVVIVDGFSGNGRKCIDFIKSNASFLQGKEVYYLTVHSMREGKKQIAREAKSAGIRLVQMSRTETTKAFQQIRVSQEERAHLREHFTDVCRSCGIREEDIFGKDNVEALCAFYNVIPGETIGIFQKGLMRI